MSFILKPCIISHVLNLLSGLPRILLINYKSSEVRKWLFQQIFLTLNPRLSLRFHTASTLHGEPPVLRDRLAKSDEYVSMQGHVHMAG